jgi:hypothetical protein
MCLSPLASKRWRQSEVYFKKSEFHFSVPAFAAIAAQYLEIRRSCHELGDGHRLIVLPPTNARVAIT